jgi:hypothetical protein
MVNFLLTWSTHFSWIKDSSRKLIHTCSSWFGNGKVLIGYRLITNEERHKINMTDDNSCYRCQHGPESIIHVLRDCKEAMKFWSWIIKPYNWAKLFSLGLISWLEWNLGDEDIGIRPRVTSFGVSVNALCKDHNKLIFNQYFNLRQN